MRKPNKLPAEVVKLFKPLLEAEYTAFYFYKSAANWCNGAGFMLAGKYFEAECANEIAHANKLQKYLVDWNVDPDLPMIEAVDAGEGLLEIIENAYDIEYALYEKYEDVSITAFEKGHICTFDLFQFFRNTQNQSVAEYSDMLNILEGCNTDSKFEMLKIEENLFGEG